MMMHTKRQNIFLIPVFSILLIWNTVYSQTVDEVIAYADMQYAGGNYRVAAKEFQRAYFFAAKKQLSSLSMRIGDSYFAMQDYEKATSFYQKAVRFERDDSLRVEALFKKVSSEILQGDYLLALMDLKSYRLSMNANQVQVQQFLYGMAYFGKEDFENAEISFLNTLDSSEVEKRNAIIDIFSKKRKYMSPNPKTAMWMSLALPGLGQLYAGDIKNSFNSFVLTAGLMFLAAYISYEYSLVDAVVGVAPWLQRYYTGGYTHAEDIAFKKRQKKRDKTFRRIYHVLMD
jgi:tetratricopeptide (TPR) repeat protein